MVLFKILAYHEAFCILMLEYIFWLLAGGVICFHHLFPMIGQWLTNLCRRLKDKEKENRQWAERFLKEGLKQRDKKKR